MQSHDQDYDDTTPVTPEWWNMIETENAEPYATRSWRYFQVVIEEDEP